MSTLSEWREYLCRLFFLPLAFAGALCWLLFGCYGIPLSSGWPETIGLMFVLLLIRHSGDVSNAMAAEKAKRNWERRQS